MTCSEFSQIASSGGTPICRGYQVPVNRPPFLRQSYNQWPPFFSVHTQWPHFFHFCIKFYIKIANFCALREHFEKFNDFVAILTENLQILPWNCICTLNDPHFWESTPKKPPFFWCPHRMTPFIQRNLTLNAPYFRSLVGTYRSLSYLSAPPGIASHIWRILKV